MKEIIEEIKANREKIEAEIIAIRRDIHAHPEIGFEEVRTSELVISKLEELGIEVKKNIAKTGVVGTLKGKHPGKTILLRADMDALRMTELNDVEYKSKHEGVMHGCGHDVHTAWLLGAAMILSKMKDELCGTVKFLFQPAEEGDGGAHIMIKEGVLENPRVDAVVGAHVWPGSETGKIGLKYGTVMAASDDFNITITGKGGHSSQPSKCIDPLRLGVQVYSALQNIVYTEVNALEPAVLAITKFNSGSANNVIPNSLELGGSVRLTSYETSKKIPLVMEQIIKGIVEPHGATYELDYNSFCPPLVNNDEMTALLVKVGIDSFGEDDVDVWKDPLLGGEDFAYFSKEVPGAFFFVGTTNTREGVINEPHNPYFDIDESIMFKASMMFTNVVLEYLNGEGNVIKSFR